MQGLCASLIDLYGIDLYRLIGYVHFCHVGQGTPMDHASATPLLVDIIKRMQPDKLSFLGLSNTGLTDQHVRVFSAALPSRHKSAVQPSKRMSLELHVTSFPMHFWSL